MTAMQAIAASGPFMGTSSGLSRPVVLVVEDEELLLQVTADSLRDAGFEVLEASDARSAMSTLTARSDISVMVTDVRMPGEMDGQALARKVRERWPFVSILMVSGYAAPHRQEGMADWTFLTKPFDLDHLTERVASLARRRM